MADLTDPNPPLQANAAGDTYKPKTTPFSGVHVHHTMPADPADGAAIKAASQADVQAVRDRLPESPHAQPLTDAQLRASTVPVTDAATQAAIAAVTAALAGLLKVARRRDSDAAPVADGELCEISINEYGRVKVSTMPGIYPLVTGVINAIGQSVSVDVSRCSNVQLHVVAASLVGHNATFEGSIDSTDGTNGNWFVIQAVRSNANTIETTTGTLTTTPTYGWELSVNGLEWIRVRATTHTSGTATWKAKRASYATEPIPAAQISGTQPVSIGTSGLTVYTDSSTSLAAGATYTGTSRDGGSTPAYNIFAAHAFANVAGTLRIEKSTDGTTWRLAKSTSVGAGEGQELVVRATTRYHRVVYVNGAGAQAQFLLTSSYQRI